MSGIFGYFRVFSGIYGYLRVYTGILDIISFLVVVSKILRFDGSSGDLEDILKSGCSCDDNDIFDNKVYEVWNGEIYIQWGRGTDQ